MSEQTPEIPFKSSILPTLLEEETRIRFRCHTGISCFNACCKRADVTLAPYDVVRLKQRLAMTSTGKQASKKRGSSRSKSRNGIVSAWSTCSTKYSYSSRVIGQLM